MSIVRVARPAESLLGALAALNEQVLHTVARRRIEQQEIIRVEVTLKPFDILAWLDSQREQTKIYWRDRETGVEHAGIGVVESIKIGSHRELSHQRERLATLTKGGCRLFGGLPFDARREIDQRRAECASGTFILPGIDAIVESDTATLACNISMQDSLLYSRLACLNDVDPTIWIHALSPTVCHRRESTSRERWDEIITRTLSLIAAGTIQKLVPARQLRLELSAPLNPWLALSRLKTYAAGVSLFGFQFDDTRAFVGASPERLFKRRGRSVFTEAIAGTVARGVDHEHDARLASQLLASEKDRREHRLVADFLDAHLAPLTTSRTVGETEVLTLPHLHHLKTPIQAALCEGVADLDLLTALHPTPAVAGLPRETALDFVREMEPFDRGWYAGPVGWMNADAAEFAVAIRSVLMEGKELILTAGAGIVAGSDPRAEWDEIEQKMRSSLDVILP